VSKVAFKDPAELPQVAVVDHPEDHCLEAFCRRCNHEVDAVCPKCSSNVDTAGHVHSNEKGAVLRHPEFYRRLMTMLRTARQTKFTLDCYFIATGDAYADGISMTDVGRTWGVTKAAVSKHCRAICAYLGIAPSPYMRKEQAAETFRLSNRRPIKYE